MAHLQYIPGDPRLVDQLVYELKSKGIFDQFRKDCIADVDTRPAYQNLRQRVENSVSSFLSRQVWKPDLNKNQLREKLRKHILDGNYLEQGVERIVDQVVNPKVASVFIPQVEDLVYNYLGITRKKSAPVAETSNGKVTNNDLLPTDLEAVSPGSVKSNDDVNEAMDISENGEEMKMDVDEKLKEVKDEKHKVKADPQDTQLSGISELASNDSGSLDKSTIPLPSEEIKLENIPAPENSPPKAAKVKLELENIRLPLEPNLPTDIPLPEEVPKQESEHYFKPIGIQSDDDESSSDSSLIRNMSPLTPIRNFNNENSCDAQQAFEDDANDSKSDEKKESAEPSSFRFTIEAKTENSSDAVKTEKKESEALSYQFNNQVNINTFNTPMYDDSSNSNHLQIDYESDASKNNTENKIPEPDHNSEDSRKDKKPDEKKSSHRSSHHRDSHKHSSSKDRKSDSKQSSSKDSKSDKKSSKEDHRSSSKSSSHHKDKSSERSDKKDSRDSSKHRSSSSHKSSSSNRDSKSHRSSSSSQRHSSSSKHSDERKSSSSHKDKSDRSSDKNSKDKSSKDSKSSSSSHRSDKDRKSSSSSKTKSDDKDKQKKEKKETDDHYSASGRGSHTRRSTDRDSNDGSSSSKGSHNQPSSKSSEVKKESKGSTSKSDNTSTSGDSASPSDKEVAVNEMKDKVESVSQVRPVVRIENHLEVPISSPPRLPFVPDVTLKKPKFAANMQEARKLMKMRKFLDEEQKRMNQEAALLLEFQANVRPSLSQVYSSIPGPELEFACVTNTPREMIIAESERSEAVTGQGNNQADSLETRNDTISDILTAAQQVENIEVNTIDRQDTETVNHSENTETVREAEDDAEDESEESNKAKVQLENITEAKIGESVDMEIDAVDEKKVKIERTLDNDIGDSKKIISNVASDNTEVISEIKVEVIPHLNSDGPDDDGIEKRLQSLMEDSDNTHTEYFQVTIITEELSESEETDTAIPIIPVEIKEDVCPGESPFKYFAEHEKFTAEIERDTFSKFLKSFINKTSIQKMHVVNCDSYEESIIKEVSQNFGQFEIVNYYKNGRLKLNSAARNIVRNVNVDSEIFLPNVNHERSPVQIFSPVKSECSFELSSDYDAKLEEMVSKTSRKEIMEIILGNVVDGSATEMNEMPTIDYCNESSIESDTENTMKRKYCEVGSSVNNNRQVLTPNKIRKLSGSDQISSTTEESEETSNNNVVTNPIRSKYLGRAKRVGLPRPRRTNLPNSPSSDKSVENYEENGQTTQQPNGKLKAPRNKVQRYDTSDLYKPKLHYLSRRNNIS